MEVHELHRGRLLDRLQVAVSDLDAGRRFYSRKDNGKPGEAKAHHPGYDAAFVTDPDGNNVEAVYHGAANRSAASVKIAF